MKTFMLSVFILATLLLGSFSNLRFISKVRTLATTSLDIVKVESEVALPPDNHAILTVIEPQSEFIAFVIVHPQNEHRLKPNKSLNPLYLAHPPPALS